MPNQLKTIGQRIKAIRKGLRLTQKQFAERLGISDKSVSCYELGDVELSIGTLIGICQVGNVTPDWLIFGFESRPDGLSHQEAMLVLAYRKSSKEDKEALVRFAIRAGIHNTGGRSEDV